MEQGRMFKINPNKINRALPVENQEVTDPGIVDEFIPAKSEGWIQRQFSKRGNLKLAEELMEKIERIPQAPEEAVRYYFNADLAQLMELSRRYPKEIKKMLEEAIEKSPHRSHTEPWYFLVEAACGETDPLFRAFEKMDLKNRLAVFRITLFSPHLGDGHLVRELFVRLMESTSHEERERWVEPTIHSILNRGAWAQNATVQNKLAWLNALYHGWQREAQELG